MALQWYAINLIIDSMNLYLSSAFRPEYSGNIICSRMECAISLCTCYYNIAEMCKGAIAKTLAELGLPICMQIFRFLNRFSKNFRVF